MKRLIIIGSVLVLVVILASCKKEVFQPTVQPVPTEETTPSQHRGSKAIETPTNSGSVTGTGTTHGGVGGEITDPNDDDYSKRPSKKNK